MSNINKEASELALKVAATSIAKKRKVGCVIVIDGKIEAQACNFNPNGACEDDLGNTLPTTVHAEVAACEEYWLQGGEGVEERCDVKSVTFYVTHEPCDNCRAVMKQFQADVQAIELNTVVVTEGMKFDSGKIDYSLIPQIAIEGLAKVLHYGARKYKPNNWRHVDPARYVSAFERHWQAYLNGELIDPETNLPHLSHCMTNLAFLLELGYVPPSQQTIADYVEKHNVAK